MYLSTMVINNCVLGGHIYVCVPAIEKEREKDLLGEARGESDRESGSDIACKETSRHAHRHYRVMRYSYSCL